MMTVLLVLMTAVVCLLVEYAYSRWQDKTPVVEGPPSVLPIPRMIPAIVGGFEVQENRLYHPGHTWALRESPDLVRVGLDDFAARLIGAFDGFRLPKRGQWIRQGQKVWTVRRNGDEISMVSPIEGIVTEVNDSLLENPGLAGEDPYGDGWVLTVRSPDSLTNFRNLLGGSLARKWAEEASERLRSRLPSGAGLVAADGGLAVEDLRAVLPEEVWMELAGEFFLTSETTHSERRAR